MRKVAAVSPHRAISCLCVVALGAVLFTGCGDDDQNQARSSASTTTAAETTTSTNVAEDALEVLVHGAALHGANGITADAEGRLFIASAWGREIAVMDPDTGKILNRYGPEDGVQIPDDVAFGPDGSLYWTDLLAGEVGRRQPDGTVTKQHIGVGVNPVAFSTDGRLFVALAFWGDGLYELDPNLTAEPREVIPDSATPPFPNQLNGMDFGPDGELYAPQPNQGKIVSIDVDTGAVTEIASGLAYPVAVDFDSRGRLFVAMTGSGEVARVDVASGAVTTVGQLGPGIDNMAFDSEDRLFVTNNGDGSVRELLASGQLREVSGPGLIGPGPLAIVTDDQGEWLYVGNLGTLVRLDGRTGQLQDYDAYGIIGDSGGMIQPHSVTADGSNVILSTWSGSVQVWDPTSNTVVQQFDGFAVPLNALRFQGDIVVAEITGNLTQVDPVAGERKTLTNALETPVGLAAMRGDLWVADWGQGTIFQVVADGEVLASPGAIVEGLDKPEGLAVDLDGTLLVVETGRRQLTRVDPTTGTTTMVATDLDVGGAAAPNTPPIWFFNDVAVSESGTIYLTGEATPAVYHIEPEEP